MIEWVTGDDVEYGVPVIRGATEFGIRDNKGRGVGYLYVIAAAAETGAGVTLWNTVTRNGHQYGASQPRQPFPNQEQAKAYAEKHVLKRLSDYKRKFG